MPESDRVNSCIRIAVDSPRLDVRARMAADDELRSRTLEEVTLAAKALVGC